MSLKPSSFSIHLSHNTIKKNSIISFHSHGINCQLKMIERAGKKLRKIKSYFNIEYLEFQQTFADKNALIDFE